MNNEDLSFQVELKLPNVQLDSISYSQSIRLPSDCIRFIVILETFETSTRAVRASQ